MISLNLYLPDIYWHCNGGSVSHITIPKSWEIAMLSLFYKDVQKGGV